jgi:hypothetical protein
MSDLEKRIWRAIEVDPVKRVQHPFGDEGGGFWVVGIIGKSVVWYNSERAV